MSDIFRSGTSKQTSSQAYETGLILTSISGSGSSFPSCQDSWYGFICHFLTSCELFSAVVCYQSCPYKPKILPETFPNTSLGLWTYINYHIRIDTLGMQSISGPIALSWQILKNRRLSMLFRHLLKFPFVIDLSSFIKTYGMLLGCYLSLLKAKPIFNLLPFSGTS